MSHPQFRSEGQITYGLEIAFPRTAVWIQHSGARRFLADPHVITLYKAGQDYAREVLSPDGDRSDWFGVTAPAAREIMEDCGADWHDGDRPLRVAHTWSDGPLYFRQRQLFHALRRGDLEALAAEQAILELIASVTRRAHEKRRSPDRRSRRTRTAHRDLAEGARAELAQDVTASLGLSDVAARLNVSPYHLCRVFRDQVGMTLHAYRLDMRLRIALERIADSNATLSELAFELGFSSHSHFTSTLRRRMALVPSVARGLLGGWPEESRRCERMSRLFNPGEMAP